MWLWKLPLRTLAAMAEYLPQVPTDAIVERQDADAVGPHVRYVTFAWMLPRCLTWSYEVCMITSEYDCEDHKEEKKAPEEEKNSLDMILHLLLFKIFHICVIDCCHYMCIMSNIQRKELLIRLEEEE